jgi:hypothetical protein
MNASCRTHKNYTPTAPSRTQSTYANDTPCDAPTDSRDARGSAGCLFAHSLTTFLNTSQQYSESSSPRKHRFQNEPVSDQCGVGRVRMYTHPTRHVNTQHVAVRWRISRVRPARAGPCSSPPAHTAVAVSATVVVVVTQRFVNRQAAACAAKVLVPRCLPACHNTIPCHTVCHWRSCHCRAATLS